MFQMRASKLTLLNFPSYFFVFVVVCCAELPDEKSFWAWKSVVSSLILDFLVERSRPEVECGGVYGHGQDHQDPCGDTSSIQNPSLFITDGCKVSPLFKIKSRQLSRVKVLFSGWRDHVWRPPRCLGDVEDRLKQRSTPNFVELAPSFVKFGPKMPNLWKLEWFEDVELKFGERRCSWTRGSDFIVTSSDLSDVQWKAHVLKKLS